MPGALVPEAPGGPAAVQALWAGLLLRSFADAGVRDVVVSPGSRSTPFLLAAARDERLHLHDVVDERAAGFFALGQARVTGRPSLLLCTSGTAGAHYLPAVIEAGMTGVPMLILTADRPVELVGCGANQTIDQVKLFGDHARAFVDLGTASDRPGALRGLRRAAAQAVFTSTWPRAGAVHLNARAHKPLEPPAGQELEERLQNLGSTPIPRPRPPASRPAAPDLERLAAACAGARRGLLVAGPAPIRHGELAPLAGELVRRTGFPLLADLASQWRTAELEEAGLLLPPADLTCTAEAWRRLAPDLVLQVGRAPTATAWTQRVAEAAGTFEHWVLSEEAWHDPESTATDLLFGDLSSTLEDLLAALPREGPRGRGGSENGRRLGEEARIVLASTLDTSPEEPLSEGAAAAAAVSAIPEGGLLTLGNSLAIRHADLFATAPADSVSVLSQRGASGIDGLVAGAAGAARVSGRVSGRVSLLLLGDVSLLHDATSLLLAPRAGEAFVVVVIDNRGGRIFELLPIAEKVPGETFSHWLTPPGEAARDFRQAAAFAGVEFRRTSRLADLRGSLDEAFTAGGPWLISAEVPPSGAKQEKRDVLSRWRRRLEALDPR